jgi:hypothetical protein
MKVTGASQPDKNRMVLFPDMVVIERIELDNFLFSTGIADTLTVDESKPTATASFE